MACTIEAKATAQACTQPSWLKKNNQMFRWFHTYNLEKHTAISRLVAFKHLIMKFQHNKVTEEQPKFLANINSTEMTY